VCDSTQGERGWAGLLRALALETPTARRDLSICAVAGRAHWEGAAIDAAGGCREDGGMGTTTYVNRRRSTRIFHRVRLRASGLASDGRKFREASQTIVLSAHGALLYLQHDVSPGALLVITNPETQEDQECRVVYLGDTSEHGRRVGVEFLTPAPHFWGIDFGDAALADWASAQTVH
jgi:hypothetical protein